MQRPLQVLPLGIGDAFSSVDYYTSMVILGGGTVCQVDCPDPIHKILRERTSAAGIPLDAGTLDHLLLTHLHGDHCNGLESLLFHRRFVSDAPPLVIHTIREVADALWPSRLAVSMGRTNMPEIGLDQRFEAEDYFRLRVVEPLKPFRIGGLEFVLRRTIHSVPTFGFRVRLVQPAGADRSFAYSCDTVFDPAHIDFLSGADLIFHECSDSSIHTPYAKLLGLEPAVRDKIHLLHLSDRFDRAASALPIVQPGTLYTV